MENHEDFNDSAEIVNEMRADYLADRESELGPEDDWTSPWFEDQP